MNVWINKIKTMRSNILYASVVRYGATSLYPRGIAILTTLIMTPLIVEKFGITRYAVWFMSTLISTIVSFPDFGISNGIINKVANSNRNSNNILSMSITLKNLNFLLKLIAVFWLLIGVLAIFLYSENYDSTINRDEFRNGMLLSLLIFVVGIPPSLWSRVQLGLERGHEAVMWEGIGKTLSFLLSGVIIFFYPNMYLLITATLLPNVITSYINEHLFTRSSLPNINSKNQKRQSLLNIIRENIITIKMGGYFTVIQIAYLFGFALDPFIIGQFMKIEAVSYFSIIRRPFDALPLVITLFSTALWPIFNRLYAEKKLQKAKKIIIQLIVISVISIVFLSLLITVFRDRVFGYLGNNTIDPQIVDLFWIALKTIAISIVIILNNYMNAVEIIERQAKIQISSAIVSFIVVLYVLRFNNLQIYFATSSIIYVLLTLIPMIYVSFSDMRRRIRSAKEIS